MILFATVVFIICWKFEYPNVIVSFMCLRKKSDDDKNVNVHWTKKGTREIYDGLYFQERRFYYVSRQDATCALFNLMEMKWCIEW